MAKKSFFITYGHLSLPVIFLTIFGWFHFKTGPLSKGYLGKFTQIYSFGVLIISEVILIGFIVTNIPSISITGRKLLFSIGVGLFMFMMIFLLVIVNLSHSRVYNNSMLIMDIYEAKINNLTHSCTIYIILCDILALSSLVYCWYNNLAIKRAALTGKYEYSQEDSTYHTLWEIKLFLRQYLICYFSHQYTVPTD